MYSLKDSADLLNGKCRKKLLDEKGWLVKGLIYLQGSGKISYLEFL